MPLNISQANAGQQDYLPGVPDLPQYNEIREAIENIFSMQSNHDGLAVIDSLYICTLQQHIEAWFEWFSSSRMSAVYADFATEVAINRALSHVDTVSESAGSLFPKEQAEEVKEVIKKLPKLKCPYCGLSGHEKSYCPQTRQAAFASRATAELKTAWIGFKQAVKLKDSLRKI